MFVHDHNYCRMESQKRKAEDEGDDDHETKRTETETSSGFDLCMEESENPVKVYTSLLDLADDYKRFFTDVSNHSKWKKATDGKKFVSFIIDLGVDVETSPIKPYVDTGKRTKNNIVIDEQVNIGKNMFHDRLRSAIKTFKVPLAEKDEYDNAKLNFKTGTTLMNGVAKWQKKSDEDDGFQWVAAMFHNDPNCAPKSHLHILICYEEGEKPVYNRQFYKFMNNNNLNPAKIEKHHCHQTAWAAGYMVAKGPGVQYLGCTNQDAAETIAGMKVWLHNEKKTGHLPRLSPAPTDVVSDEQGGGVYKDYTPREVIRFLRHLQDSQGKITPIDKCEAYGRFWAGEFHESLSIDSLRNKVVAYTPKGSTDTGFRRETLALMTGSYKVTLHTFYSNTISSFTMKDIIPKLELIGTPEEIVQFQDHVWHMLSMFHTWPDWLCQTLRVYFHLLGHNGKQNAFRLWGPHNRGKSTIWNHALGELLTMVCRPSFQGNFPCMDLRNPHLFIVIDDDDPVLTSQQSTLINIIKDMTGKGTPKVEVKGGDAVPCVVGPVIWLSNNATYNYHMLPQGDIDALECRQIKEEMNGNYYHYDNPKFWRNFHCFMLRLLLEFETRGAKIPTDVYLIKQMYWRDLYYPESRRDLTDLITSYCSKELRETRRENQTSQSSTNEPHLGPNGSIYGDDDYPPNYEHDQMDDEPQPGPSTECVPIL